jgi:phytoene dehydrogenase-like protein
MSRPALVVGAGPNGLAAAIALARGGRDVLVLEAASRPGGALATEELTLPGFLHDVFSAVHPAAAASPVFERLPLERHGLRWTQPEACYAHPLPDGRAVLLYRDLDRTAAGLEELAAGDGERWRAFAAPYLAAIEPLRRTLLSGFPPVRGPAGLLPRLGVGGTLELARLVLAPATALGRELFAHPGARAWLYGSALHSDQPPDGAGSAVGAAYLNLLGHAVGWPSPEGGAGRLAAALVAHLEELGGRVLTGARATRVLMSRRRVTGVELAGGERFASPLVVADVMPRALLALAGEEALAGRYAAALRRYRYGPATLKVDWALDEPIPWSAPAARGAGTVHVGGDEADLLESVAVARRGLPERPFLLAGQQSIADPTRAPAGRHTAWAYTHGPRGLDWAAEAPRHVERMEAQIERFAPGFRDRILARHVLAPGDLEARNANLVDGDVGGGSYELDQLVFRPVPSLSPYRTPVRGLYLASAATFPGGAVHGVSGTAAARLALREARVRRF